MFLILLHGDCQEGRLPQHALSALPFNSPAHQWLLGMEPTTETMHYASL